MPVLDTSSGADGACVPMPTFPAGSMSILKLCVVVPVAVVLKLTRVPCAVSVQFSAATTNMPLPPNAAEKVVAP